MSEFNEEYEYEDEGGEYEEPEPLEEGYEDEEPEDDEYEEPEYEPEEEGYEEPEYDELDYEPEEEGYDYENDQDGGYDVESSDDEDVEGLVNEYQPEMLDVYNSLGGSIGIKEFADRMMISPYLLGGFVNGELSIPQVAQLGGRKSRRRLFRDIA